MRRFLGPALLAACCPAPAALPPEQPAPVVARAESPPRERLLSLLSLNDLHGRLGALPAFAGYVDALRRARGDDGGVVVVDAGDMFQGTIGSNRSEGASVVAAYNALGVTAAAIGNHEFDYGPVDAASSGADAQAQGALRARAREARFPLLSANLIETNTRLLPAWENVRTSTLIDVAGVRLGFVGLTTAETPSIVMPDYFAGLALEASTHAVTREAEALRQQGAAAVIVLAHAGADCSRFDDPLDLSSCDPDEQELFGLARALPTGLVAAMIGGHTHAAVAHVVNGIPMVEALSRGKAFGRIDLRFGGAPPRLLEARPFPPEPLCPDSAELAPCASHDYAGGPTQPSAEIARLIEPALTLARAERARPLGVEVATPLPQDHDRESALGNLLVDLMRAHARGADLALSNGGGLRAPLPAGPLSYGSLYETMPFDNRLVTLTLSGAELRRVLEAHLANDTHGIVSIAGITTRSRCSGERLEVELLRPSGRRVRNEERLVLATSDYLATGGDRLFAPIGDVRSRVQPVGEVLVRDALAAEIAKLARIEAKAYFDPARPRLALPSARPVRCPR